MISIVRPVTAALISAVTVIAAEPVPAQSCVGAPHQDHRPEARYFGAVLDERTLLPGDAADLAGTRFQDWLSAQQVATQ